MRRLVVAVGSCLILAVPSTAFANHDRRDERRRCGYYECEDDGNNSDNRRAGISPGPFDRSPVDIHDNQICISPDCSQRGGESRQGGA